jgi:hypothetical protein
MTLLAESSAIDSARNANGLARITTPTTMSMMRRAIFNMDASWAKLISLLLHSSAKEARCAVGTFDKLPFRGTMPVSKGLLLDICGVLEN